MNLDLKGGIWNDYSADYWIGIYYLWNIICLLRRIIAVIHAARARCRRKRQLKRL